MIDVFIILSEDIIINRISNRQRNGKGKKSKNQTFIFVGFKLVHIQFKTGDEHNIQKTYGRKNFYFIGFQNIKTFRSDYYSRYNQPDNSGYFYFFQNDRSK